MVKFNDHFNITYDDQVVKTTVNIERDLMSKAYRRMKELGIKFFSVYLRALIRMDVENKKPMTLNQFMGKDQGQLMFEYADPPRKYMGFKGGLMRNSFVLGWFKKKSNNI